MRRVAIEDDGSVFSSDEIEYVPVEVDEDDELQALGIPWGLLDEHPGSLLPGESVEDRNERLKLQAAEQRGRDRPADGSSSSTAKDLAAMKRAVGGLGITRESRRDSVGSPFRSGGKAVRRGRPVGSGRADPDADVLRALFVKHAAAAGLSFEAFVRPAAAGTPSPVETARLDALAVAVVNARQGDATLAAIGAVIGRAPARVSELAARVA